VLPDRGHHPENGLAFDAQPDQFVH
jgi:hypothetical protein